MKYIFDKNNYIGSSLSREGKRENFFYLTVAAVMFVFGAFFFWEFIYEVTNMIGSVISKSPAVAVVELKRVLPVLISVFTFIYIGFWVQKSVKVSNLKRRSNTWKINGFVTILLGVVISAYVVMGWATGEYGRVVEQNPTLLFPLDIFVFGLAFVAVGVAAIQYSKRIIRIGSFLPYYVSGNPLTGVINVIVYFFSYCVGLTGFAACIYGVFSVDWSHGHVFYNCMLWINYLLMFLMAFFYRFIYLQLVVEYRERARRDMPFTMLAINAIALVLYIIALANDIEASGITAQGILPIDYTASFNTFFVVVIVNNIAVPVIVALKVLLGLHHRVHVIE